MFPAPEKLLGVWLILLLTAVVGALVDLSE